MLHVNLDSNALDVTTATSRVSKLLVQHNLVNAFLQGQLVYGVGALTRDPPQQAGSGAGDGTVFCVACLCVHFTPLLITARADWYILVNSLTPIRVGQYWRLLGEETVWWTPFTDLELTVLILSGSAQPGDGQDGGHRCERSPLQGYGLKELSFPSSTISE